MSPRMDRVSVTTMFVVLCLCVMMVSAKSVETSTRTKRTTTTSGTNCDSIRQLFSHRNVSFLLPAKSKGSVCGGECCGEEAENFLRKQGQEDFATLLRHNSKSLQGLLSFTGATLQNHVSEISRQSEDKTLILFSQVYKGMAVLSRELIGKLYSDIRSYILVNGSHADLSATTVDIKSSVTQFFTDFFPLVYHHILMGQINVHEYFTADYKECLKKTTETILPFGDIPKQMAQSLSKSLEATRLLLQALRIGTEVLNTTDKLLVDESAKNNAECHQALLKMTYCPKCRGLGKHTKPCSGYCLNVLRGCLTKYVIELDSPWNGFVEGVESLMNAMKKGNWESEFSADAVIKSLDMKITEAIMRAMEKGTEIGSKVKRICGSATFSEDLPKAETTPVPSTSKPRSANPRSYSALPETQFNHFLTSMSKTRGFYANLADTLCKDDNFAEPKDQRCWNGERIAEYTKTVVDAGHGMEKYNPEVKPAPTAQSIDPQVAELVEKLRHVHHMAMSSIGPTAVEDYMQRDGVEGSGSGNGSDFEDNDDEYNTRGSGSGHRPITDDEQGIGIQEHRPSSEENGKNVPTVTTAGSTSITSSMLIFVALLAMARLY